MTKDELIREVALKTSLPLKDAKASVDAALVSICEEIEKGGSVALTGFGTFASREMPERTSRNPRTGETVKVAASRKPTFRAGKTLKEAAKGTGSFINTAELHAPKLGSAVKEWKTVPMGKTSIVGIPEE